MVSGINIFNILYFYHMTCFRYFKYLFICIIERIAIYANFLFLQTHLTQ